MIFRANDITGWPKMILTLTCRDFMGRDLVCGYGVIHLPTQEGTHSRYLQIFKPKSSSTLIELIGFLNGKTAEFTQPVELLSRGVGREVTRVESAGVVKV